MPPDGRMTLGDFEALVTRLERLAPIRAWPHANTAQTAPWVMAIALPEAGEAVGEVIALLRQHGLQPLITLPVPGAHAACGPPVWIILRSDV